DGALEKDLLAGGPKAVRAHRIAQGRQRGAEGICAETGDDFPPGVALESGLYQAASVVKSYIH
ncbi:MAG: hypothetical protein ABI983_04685, partial [Acidobacteriota bacterium]